MHKEDLTKINRLKFLHMTIDVRWLQALVPVPVYIHMEGYKKQMNYDK